MKMLIRAGADLYRTDGERDIALDIIREYRPAKAKYIEGLVEMEKKISSKRLKQEDKAKAADTGFEFDI